MCRTHSRRSQKIQTPPGRMKSTDSKKLDQIITMLGDTVDIFGKRFDKIDDTLDSHTRDVNQIKKDVETNLDKRLQLEVRVDKLEKTRT
jgi:hypothetical protein